MSPYRQPPDDRVRVRPSTTDALTDAIASRSIGPSEAREALYFIVAREQLGLAATDAQIRCLAEELATLLDGDPTLEALLKP